MFKKTAITLAILAASSANAQIFVNREATVAGTYLNQIGAPAAWARGFTGKGVTIAVLDNGFDINHTDLAKNVLASQNFYLPARLGTAVTWGLHGTQMASIAAGVANGAGTIGVAPDAKLLLGQVGQGGISTSVDMNSVIEGMKWAEAKGATVINLSLGSTYDSTFKAETVQIAPGIYRAAERYTNLTRGNLGYLYGGTLDAMYKFTSATKTAVVVASAGNSATGYAQFPGEYATKTDANGNLLLGGRVLIVGNVKQNSKTGAWTLDANSNAAGSICASIVSNVCQDKYYVKDFYVVAPGSAILGAVPDAARSTAGVASGGTNGVGSASGTSPAAALVSGGIAVLKQAWPQLSASQLVQLVTGTATAIGDSNVYGKGLVNFDKATQPYGDVKYTKASLKNGISGTTTALTGTAVVSRGSVGSTLATNGVLANVQVADSLGRNYTSDFTRAIGSTAGVNALYTSPYLAMQGSANYREFATPLGQDGVMTVMSSTNGAAVQYEADYKESRVNLQIGSMAEQSGFLNNYGAGLMGFGNSNTTWAIAGGSVPITTKTSLVGNYGVGISKTANAAGSLVALSPIMISDTWKLGVATKNIFFDSKSKDTLTFAVQGPVSIRKGNATATAVTGYTYSDGVDGDTTASPVTTSQRSNLANGARDYNLVMSYSVAVSNSTYFGASVARQYTAFGTVTNSASLVVRSVF